MAEAKQIVIKKYPNRRLYNTEISSYITLEELSNLIKKEAEFKVIDAKTGEDITRITLTQIILEHEMKGYNLLPMNFLKQIIKFYDHSMSSVFQNYLFTSMEYFNKNQEGIEKFMENFSGNLGTFGDPWKKVWGDISKQNNDFLQMFLNNLSNASGIKNDKNKKDSDN